MAPTKWHKAITGYPTLETSKVRGSKRKPRRSATPGPVVVISEMTWTEKGQLAYMVPKLCCFQAYNSEVSSALLGYHQTEAAVSEVATGRV